MNNQWKKVIAFALADMLTNLQVWFTCKPVELSTLHMKESETSEGQSKGIRRVDREPSWDEWGPRFRSVLAMGPTKSWILGSSEQGGLNEKGKKKNKTNKTRGILNNNNNRTNCIGCTLLVILV